VASSKPTPMQVDESGEDGGARKVKPISSARGGSQAPTGSLASPEVPVGWTPQECELFVESEETDRRRREAEGEADRPPDRRRRRGKG
jgi:hypothetical protein